MHRMWTLVLLLAIFSAGMSSCASIRGKFGGGGRAQTAVTERAEVVSLAPNEARRTLRGSVESYLGRVESGAAAAKSRVLRKKPYFLKEYDVYPADAANIMVIEMQETESRTAPFRAEVTLPKTRYATRLHRTREAARKDEDFIRQAGRETLSFTMRSGRWRALGSAFVADRTEAASGGVWRETTGAAGVAAGDAKKKGWFGRQWSRVFGG